MSRRAHRANNVVPFAPFLPPASDFLQTVFPHFRQQFPVAR